MNKYYVYALVDPINRIPFYVGKGCGKRAWDHLGSSDKVNSSKHKRIDMIRMLRFEPKVVMFKENLGNDEAYDLESSMIKICREYFPYLTNICDGNCMPSRRGASMSEAARKKISDANKRRIYKPMSAEQKKKLSIANFGKKMSEESKKKLSDAITGRGFYLSKNELVELMKTNSIRAIGRKFRVSSIPIRKLILRYGIAGM